MVRRAGPLRAVRGVVAVLAATTGLVLGPAGQARAAETAPRVVVIAVPDLLWSDLSPTQTPAIWQLLRQGASGALSVKSEWQLAGCADGLLTLGAGDRVAAEPSSARARPCAGTSPEDVSGDRTSAATGSGRLAAALRARGITMAAYGDGAALALPDADATGPLGTQIPADAAQVVVAVDDAVYAARATARAAAARAVDVRLAGLIAPLPSTTTVLLVGSSDQPEAAGGAAEAHLHVAIARGPAFQPGSLRSPSTKRAPYVELIDVAPTVLSLVGVPAPSGMVGRSWERTVGASDPAERAAALRDADVKAVQGAHWRPAFMWALSLLALVIGLAGLLLLPSRRAGRRTRIVTSHAALVVAALPVASWLVQLLPWWRWPALVLPLLLLAGAAVVGAVAALAGRAGSTDPTGPTSSIGPLLVVTGVSAGVLVIDLVTGSRLQTAALLGDSPITAGRFYGAGNTAFGVLAVSALLGTAVACAHVAAGATRVTMLRWAAVAGAVLLTVAGVDGAPSLGADLGGALAFLPSALLLVLLLTGGRPTGRRVLVALGAGIVPVVALAAWDYHRRPDRRTHIGDFVAELLHGQAGAVLHRKLAANLGQLGSSPFLPLVAGAVLGAVVLLVLGRRGPGADLVRLVAGTPGLGPGLVAVLGCAVLGGVLNDSGVTVTGIMLSVALPVVTALALRADPVDRTARTDVPDTADTADTVDTG